MITVDGLDADLTDLGTALGLLVPTTGGGTRLDETFFTDPWGRVGRLVSDADQRAALVRAVAALLPQDDPRFPAVATDPLGVRTRHVPLLASDGKGQLFLRVREEGSGRLTLGLAAEGGPIAGGPGVTAQLDLLVADGDTVRPVAATPEHPVRLRVRTPLGDTGATAEAAVLLVAPPHEARTRLTVTVTGLPGTSAPLVLDPGTGSAGAATLVTALLRLVLAELSGTIPEPVRLVAEHLPGLLGLTPGMPPLPMDRLAEGPAAFRDWLAGLVTSRTEAGEPGLVAWLDSLGQLLGRPASGRTALPTEADPMVFELLDTPAVALTVAVRADPATGSTALVWGVRVGYVGTGVDARVDGDAVLLVMPLGDATPVTLFERLDLVLTSPASGGRLFPAAGEPAGGFRVGRLRAGVRYTAADRAVRPLLELRDVLIDLDGTPTELPLVDLTDARSLTAAAQSLLTEAIDAGLGPAAGPVAALRRLVGLGTTPGVDLGLLTTAPAAAVAGYYRALRATPQGWAPVLADLARLAGVSAPVVTGAGTAADPWQVDLPAFTGTALATRLSLWDAGTPGAPVLVLGLGLAAGAVLDPARPWRADARLTLLTVPLAPDSGAATWLGSATVAAEFAAATPVVGPVTVRTESVRVEAGWSLGAPVTAAAIARGLTVVVDGTPYPLGDLRLPAAGPVDPTRPDLGLGIPAGTLWAATRALLSRVAASWGGPAARDLLALVGLGGPDATGGSAGVPALLPPDPDDLTSLLAGPADAVRAWLAALARDAAGGTAPAGPPLRRLLELVQALLTDRLPALPGQPLPAPDLPVDGSGTPVVPWRVPLHRAGGDGVELLTWLEPAGPPAAWALDPLLERYLTVPETETESAAGAEAAPRDPLTGADVLAAGRLAGAYRPELDALLSAVDPAHAALAVDALAELLAEGDGLVAADASAAAGLRVGDLVDAAHHDLPAAPATVAQVRASIAEYTAAAGDGWAVLLLAPPLAGARPWEALLEGVTAADVCRVDLRVPGTSPERVDLGALTAARWYVVDLGDDGTLPAATALAALRRVHDAVRATRPGVRTVLVGHSYLGQVARRLAATVPGEVLGLTTVGTPADNAVLPVDAPVVADGVRLARLLAPAGTPDGPAVDAALRLLGQLLDGYAATPPGQAPAALPLPAAAFARWAPPTAAPAVPTLAVHGRLRADLRELLANALTWHTSAAAPDLPTAAAGAVRLGLDLGPAQPGDPEVTADVRLGLGRVALLPDADADGAAPALEVRLRVSRPDGWLLGGPGDGRPLDARVRAWTVEASVAAGRTSVAVLLHDVAVRGEAAAVVDLADPRTPPLLDALVRELDRAARPGGRLARLLDALAALGVLRRATGGQPAAVLADATAALTDDPAAFLAARLPALVDRAAGLLGLARDPGAADGVGPWRRRLPNLPVELLLEPGPWRLTARTVGDGLRLGHGARFTGSTTVTLGDARPTARAALGVGALRLTAGDGRLTLDTSWLDGPVELAPAPPDLAARLAPLLPRLLVDSALGVLLEQLAGPGVQVGTLSRLLTLPGGWLAETFAPEPGRPPLAGPLADVLRLAAGPLGLADDPAHTLTLPGGLTVDLADVGTGADRRLRLTVGTAAPVELWAADGRPATLGVGLRLDVDGARQVRPAGDLALRVPLPGDWDAVELRLGADPAGLALAVTPVGLGATLTLLPAVSGMDDLVDAAAQRLLPEVLDRLVAAVGARTPRPAILDDALAALEALGVYDPAAAPHGFAARAGALADLAEELAAGGLADLGRHAGPALAAVLRRVLGADRVPAQDPARPGLLVVRADGPLGAGLALRVDLGAAPPTVELRAAGLTAGALTGDVVVGYAHPAVTAALTVGAAVDTGFGIVLRGRLAVSAGPAEVGVRLGLLGSDAAGTGELSVRLAPQVVLPSEAEVRRLVEQTVVPLAGTLALRAARPWLDRPLWAGGRSTAQLLSAVGVAVPHPDGLRMSTSLPAPPALLKGLLDAVAGVDVPLPGDLALRVVADGARYGLAVRGDLPVAVGDVAVVLRFALPAGLDPGWGETGRGTGLLLLDLTDPAAPVVAPVLRLGGFGVRVAAAAPGAALVDTGGFRLGAVAGHVRADIPLTGAGALRRPPVLDGALALEGLGFPVASGAGGNPVAASLLQSDGSGDPSPVNPPLDLTVARAGTRWQVLFGGRTEARFDIQRGFGPLHIAEIALLYQQATAGPGKIGMAIDGGVAISGLTLDVDDLSVLVPLRTPTDLRTWQLDLAGLSVSFSSPSVSIAGGLRKAVGAGGGVQYDGMLSVDLAGRGLTAVGSYARPRDSLGEYTSLFVFLSVGTPLGGPPYLFVLGLGGGAGYNRRLLVPSDPQAVPAFPLVKAITDGGFAGDGGPMAALARMSADIPPARGAFWLAAGVKFSTFGLLNTTAVAYLAVDRSVEVGLLGLMRLALPSADSAIVNVELALAARYSTLDRVLSVRAALTRNSWLLSRDCRLTGGFALMVWMDRSDVLLSIGGYHPAFARPAHYPEVPRVGFNWAVGSGVVVKGQSYFTLTPSTVMVGGRLEASYDRSPVRVWFTAALDVMVSWDPLKYVADVSVSVGARFTIKVCFFACARISVSVSLGARVHIEGPPLRGTVTVDLAIASVTVRFGRSVTQPYLTWPEVTAKYLGNGDPARAATATTVTAGTLPPAPGSRPDGTPQRPWSTAPEFAVRVESAMPLYGWRLAGAGRPDDTAGGREVDVVPAGHGVGRVRAVLAVVVERSTAAGWAPLAAAELAGLRPTTAATGFPAALWDGAAAGRGGPDPVVRALSGVTLAAPVAVAGSPGAVRDVPLSTLIEEEDPHPLPLPAGASAPAPTGLAARVAARVAALRGAPEDAARRLAPVAPRLRATVSPDQRRGRRAAGPHPAVLATEPHLAALPAGHTQLWDVSDAAGYRLRLAESGAGEALRLATFTSTGAPIGDGPARAGAALPDGAATAVVTAAPADGAAGWAADTPLVPVTEGVLVAAGATVRLPHPWRPPARYRRAGEHVPVPAALLAAEVDGLVTDLPTGVRRIVVTVEATARDADCDEVLVDVDGVRVSGRYHTPEPGPRQRIVLGVEADESARAISVTVRTGDRWRLAGVVGDSDDSIDPDDAAARASLAGGVAPVGAERRAVAASAPTALVGFELDPAQAAPVTTEG
ncbi:DUF6603 domain-containing protein [Micromonospora okii]|uniref:DUF6603 domain-containing protein n=1 Tax=Micromonospora okii TaxID=1182970 RepID=UPI001E53AFAC|nr:DUF6603 domain-containing protein [Micromonospora okii]